jgi:hypothetical protein
MFAAQVARESLGRQFDYQGEEQGALDAPGLPSSFSA